VREAGGEDHDASYRLLFSHRRMMGDLLHGYIREEWVAGLDLDTLERCGEVEIGPGLERREEDLVWRVRWRDERAPIYLLIEFQPAVDPYMAVRNMTYLGLRFEGLIRRRELSSQGKLPAVVPVVLYNGRREWTAAREISALVERVPDGPDRYVPRLRYLLVDGMREPAPPGEPGNLVGLLFALEQSRSLEEIDRGIAHLTAALAGSGDSELGRSFTLFLRRSLLPARFPGAVIPAVADLEEVRPMLRETVREWTQQWLEEGRQQGEAELLTEQLEHKFGPLDETQHAAIRQADRERLLAWGKCVLTARSLDEVLGS